MDGDRLGEKEDETVLRKKRVEVLEREDENWFWEREKLRSDF